MNLETAKEFQKKAFNCLQTPYPFSNRNIQDIYKSIGNGVGVTTDKYGKNYKLNIHISYPWDKPFILNKLTNIKDLDLKNDIIFRLTGKAKLLYSKYRGLKVAHYKTWENNTETYGTLGGIVKNRRNGDLLILSCNHVLANINKGEIGDKIIYLNENTELPKQKDIKFLNFFNNNKIRKIYNPMEIGNLVKYKEIKYPPYTNDIDAAIATIRDIDNIKVDENINSGLFVDFKGFYNNEFIISNLTNKKVFKIGATTGKTVGRIVDVCGSHWFPYETKKQFCFHKQREASFNNVISIETEQSEKPFAQPGDSGSIIYDENNYAVGLLFAGSASTTYAVPISTVLEFFDIELISFN